MSSKQWSLHIGTTVIEKGVLFRAWAPLAKRVTVLTSGRAEAETPLARDGEYFSGCVTGVKAGTLYRFRVDNGEPRPDPASRFQPMGVHGSSQVVDLSLFQRSDAAWKGLFLKRKRK